jgi:hypothetical protein
MRKALIAAIVAAALFAVGAFAAEFTVNAEDVASGADAVTACADAVDITFTTDADAATADTPGEWRATSATATFYRVVEVEGQEVTEEADCDGYTAKLALIVAGVTAEYDGNAAVDGSTVDFTVGELAEEITNAAVVVGGKTLTADTLNLP